MQKNYRFSKIYKEINYLSELIILNFYIENNFLDFNVKSFNKNFISRIDTSAYILKNNLNYLKFDFIPNYFDKNLILGFDIKDKESLWSGKNLYKLYQDAYTPWEWHQEIFKRGATT